MNGRPAFRKTSKNEASGENTELLRIVLWNARLILQVFVPHLENRRLKFLWT